MKLRILLCLLLSLIAGQAAWGAGPSLPQILSGSAAAQGDKSIEIVPDPAQLRADWWLFFNVEPKALHERGRKVRELLERRYGSDDADAGGSRSGEVARILANLDAYIAARQVEPPEPLALPDIAQMYSPEQALELVSSLRQARIDLDLDLNDVVALQEAVESARAEVDRSMAAYLQLSGGQSEKIAPGLSVMAERISLAASEWQLRQRRGVLAVRQARVDALTEVERRAEQRLRGDAAELAALTTRLAALDRDIDAATRRLAIEKRRVLQSTVETLEQQIAGRIAQQRVVRAAIQLETLELNRRRLSLQSGLNRLMLDSSPDLAAARAELALAREAAERAERNAGAWIAASERERDRAGERLATAAGAQANEAARALLESSQNRLRMAQESIGLVQGLRDQIMQVQFLARWTETTIGAHEGGIARAFGRVSAAGGEFGHWLGSVTDRSLFKLGETPITLSGLTKVLVTVLIAWLVSWLFRRALGQLGSRFPKENQSLLFVISRLSHYAIILIGVVAGLSTIGLSLANFALVAGALALGVGFGLQTIVNNFLSGLILFFERTVKVGDFVELDDGHRGEVRAINVRGTVVNTNDNIDIVVPNSQFTERRFINWTLLDPFRRIHVRFRVAYESDEDKVVEAGLDAAARLSSTLTGVLGREPSVWLADYGENGLEFELIVWLMPDAVKRPDAVFAAYQWEIRKALRRHGIEVPVPQREIRFRGPLPGALEP